MVLLVVAPDGSPQAVGLVLAVGLVGLVLDRLLRVGLVGLVLDQCLRVDLVVLGQRLLVVVAVPAVVCPRVGLVVGLDRCLCVVVGVPQQVVRANLVGAEVVVEAVDESKKKKCVDYEIEILEMESASHEMKSVKLASVKRSGVPAHQFAGVNIVMANYQVHRHWLFGTVSITQRFDSVEMCSDAPTSTLDVHLRVEDVAPNDTIVVTADDFDYIHSRMVMG